MTEIENLKQQLEETRLAYLNALQMSKVKGEYLSRIAHELRSPISSLMSLHQLIISDLCEDEKEEREFIIKAFEYTQKLLELMNEVVEMSQLEAEKVSLNIQTLQLTAIFAKLYKLIHLQIADRNLKLIINTIEPNVYVKGDENKLIQCLVNSIDASLNHLEMGTIIIDAQKSADENSMAINIDIPININIWQENIHSDLLTLEEVKHNLKLPKFSPFMRVDLCKQILEKMGGDLQLFDISPYNEKNNITRLQVRLPFVDLSRQIR